MRRKFHVELTSSAEEDLRRIYDFSAEDSPASARLWVDVLEKAILSLEVVPQRCAAIPEAADVGRQYRHLMVDSYRAIFRITGSRVFILRIVHGAQLLDTTILES